jgi:WD40 repeat protein
VIVLKGRGRIDLVRFSPDGSMLAALANGGTRLWQEIRHGLQAQRLDSLTPRGYHLEFASRGKLLITVDDGLRVFDIASGAVTEVPLRSSHWAPPNLAVTPDGTGLLVTEYNARDDLYDPGVAFLGYRPADNPVLTRWWREFPREWGAVAFLPDGRDFIVRQSGNMTLGGGWRFVQRSTATGDEVRQSDLLDVCLCRDPDQWLVSPDGRWIVDRILARLRVYQLSEPFGKRIATIPNDGPKHYTHIAFHPSGRYLAATSNDRTVKLYDTTTWNVARAFAWEIGRLRSVAFSPDGMLAAAGSDTGKVVVWDVDV